MPKTSKKILLGVTGSIAAYKACDIIRRFQDKNCDVTVVMTTEAEQFITPLTLSSLAGKPVYSKMFDQAELPWKMPHIELAKEADGIVIAPATANIIAKLAYGLADDLLTCLVLCAKSPIFIVPAMNDEMYQNAIVEENCKKLKTRGFNFIEPTKGKLACGVVGVGHLADADVIVQKTLDVI